MYGIIVDMKVLVFGANGFIGGEVVKLFRSKGESVVGVGRSELNDISADISNRQEVEAVIGGEAPDVIINCAGATNVGDDVDVNRRITEVILRAVVSTNIRVRTLIIGSAASYGVVGDVDELPVKEALRLNASNGYGLSKKREEGFALSFAREHGLEVLVFRLFNCIGPGMKDHYLLPSLIRQLRSHKDPVEVGRIDAMRDYIDVRDVAKALYLVSTTSNCPHDVYNLGSGVTTSTEDLYMIVSRQLLGEGPPPRIVSTSLSPEKVVASHADIRRLYDDFQWLPSIPLKQTIKDVVEYEKK